MRTTVDIDVSVLDELKRRARKERKSLGALMSELLASTLAERDQEARPPFRWHSKDMGSFVDLEDKDAVEEALGDS